MQSNPTADSYIWPQQEQQGRRRLGLLIAALGSIVLVAVCGLQILNATGVTDRVFENWRPSLYAYVFWSITVCVAVVLVKGERGQRAVFLLPALLFTIAMVIFPTAFGLYIAFTDWNLSSIMGRQFSGLDNLRKLFRDGQFWNAMLNMVYYVIAVLGQYAIAFGLALLLNQQIRFRKLFRVIFLMPFMLSPVAVSWMIGKSIFDSRWGPASNLARALGWDQPAFFATPWIARFSIMGMDAWYSIPFVMLLLLAGLQALPGEILESAKVDGATGWQSFWHMSFPLMLPVSITAVVIRVIFELKLADIVLTVTGGAPGGATDSVSSYIFREYNTRSNVGYGTMLAQFYLVVIIIFILLALTLISRWMRKYT
ncbi:MAG TPA: sugar ABC transporter permease [Thermomicrobiales bacterium]|nr:sugar ABC transporter permease [Thermomicrobiales bacterium]